MHTHPNPKIADIFMKKCSESQKADSLSSIEYWKARQVASLASLNSYKSAQIDLIDLMQKLYLAAASMADKSQYLGLSYEVLLDIQNEHDIPISLVEREAQTLTSLRNPGASLLLEQIVNDAKRNSVSAIEVHKILPRVPLSEIIKIIETS